MWAGRGASGRKADDKKMFAFSPVAAFPFDTVYEKGDANAAAGGLEAHDNGFAVLSGPGEAGVAAIVAPEEAKKAWG